MQLQDLPTLRLLAELGRRCQDQVQAAAVASIPLWARPVLVAVAEEEGILLADLMTVSSRQPAAALARHLAMAILHETQPARSLGEISGLWRQDHGMVLHARRRIRLLAAQSGDARAKHHRILTSLAAHACRRTTPRGTIERKHATAQ